jgi:hypothetical protein
MKTSLVNLLKAVEDGRIKMEKHPKYPELVIFNYTKMTALERD